MNLEKLKQKSKEAGFTIQELEKQTGLSNGSIGKWAKSSPNSENLSKVADALNCSVDYLLGRENKTKEPAAIFEDERQAELNAIFERMPDETSKDKLLQLVRSFEITNKYEIGHRYIGGIAAKGGNKPIVHRIPPKKK